MAVTVVMVVIFYAGGVVEDTKGTNYEEPLITETFIIWAYILLAIAIGLTLIFSFINMLSNPKGAKKSLIGILGAAVIIFLAYSLADDSLLNLPHYTGKDNVPATLKMVDTGLFTTYIFAGLAVASIIYVEIAKAFK